MPNYVIKALKKLEHPVPNKPQHSPHRWIHKTYGQKVHYAPSDDTSDLLSPKETTHIQRIVGSFLYYARAIDNTTHVAINDLGTTQAKPTKKTNDQAVMLMDYLFTHPDAKIRYHASGMQLYIDSDAAYLVAPQAKSRIAGYFYLSDKYTQGSGNPHPQFNGPIHIECQLLKHVVSSAAEAETSAIFLNCKTAIWIKHMLEALGHQQKIIPLKTDNSTADSFSNSTLKERKSKAWDMRLYWIKDRVTGKEFYIYWSAGANNFADYFTKHFSPSYHQQIRPTYILKNHNVSSTEHPREGVLVYQDIIPWGSLDISPGRSATHD